MTVPALEVPSPQLTRAVNSLAGEIDPRAVNVVTGPVQAVPSTGWGVRAGTATFSPGWRVAVAVDRVGAASSDKKVVPWGRRAVVKLIVPEPTVRPLVVRFEKVLSGPW